jgi:hypothetical protein
MGFERVGKGLGDTFERGGGSCVRSTPRPGGLGLGVFPNEQMPRGRDLPLVYKKEWRFWESRWDKVQEVKVGWDKKTVEVLVVLAG